MGSPSQSLENTTIFGLLLPELADEVVLRRLPDRHADVVVAGRGIEPQHVPEETRVVREVEDALAGRYVGAHDRAQVVDEARPDRFGRRREDGAKERLAIEDVSDARDGRLAWRKRGEMRRHRSGEGEEAGRSPDQQDDQERERHGVPRQPGRPRREPCLGGGDDAVDRVEEDGQHQLEGLVHVIRAADVLDVVEADEDRRCAHRPIVHGDRPRVRSPRGEVPDREEQQYDRSAGGEDVVSVPTERVGVCPSPSLTVRPPVSS